MNKFRTVDLFCGGGGLSQGLQNAGFDIVAAFDWWQPAINFYNQNIVGHSAYKQDLSNVEETIERIRKWSPNVIVGGPPCQDFSSAGKRDEGGGRASLTTAYAQIVCAVHPQLFIMENVDRAIKAKIYKEALSIFATAGYHLTIAVLDASLCGVPQRRKRVVVVGSLKESSVPLIDIYKNMQSDKPMTVRDYLGDSLGIEFYYRHPRSYARRAIFSIDEPSPTVRGVNRPIPSGYPGHPGDAAPVTTKNLRQLTTKERSLLQTFPKEWVMIGAKSELEQIIGNAVPVKLGEFVGRAIKKVDSISPLVVQPSKSTEYKKPKEEPETIRQSFFVFEQKARYELRGGMAQIEPTKCISVAIPPLKPIKCRYKRKPANG